LINLRNIALVLALGIGVSGCTPETGPKSGSVEESCQQKGGQVVIGLVGPTCAMPTPDAGKSCKKASDCSESCLGETMTCSKIKPLFGCYEVVMEDGQKVGLCVD
jgi:hypothetical protein